MGPADTPAALWSGGTASDSSTTPGLSYHPRPLPPTQATFPSRSGAYAIFLATSLIICPCIPDEADTVVGRSQSPTQRSGHEASFLTSTKADPVLGLIDNLLPQSLITGSPGYPW